MSPDLPPTPTPRAVDPPIAPSRSRHRSPWRWLAVVLVSCALLGWGLARSLTLDAAIAAPIPATAPVAPPAQLPPADPNGQVDVLLPHLAAGEDLYRNTCGTCHIALPPAVLPSPTWQELIQSPEHYGVTITPESGSDLVLLWAYLSEYSRALPAEETVPYRLARSRYFRVLHPRVDLPQTLRLDSCQTCHPRAPFYNFRTLAAEWEDAP